MLGLYQKVRKTPETRSTTKLHSAISPSMQDQGAGKTLRMCFFETVARPSRSSAQVTAPPTLDGLFTLAALRPVTAELIADSPTFPIARAHGFREVAHGHEVALGVDAHR